MISVIATNTNVHKYQNTMINLWAVVLICPKCGLLRCRWLLIGMKCQHCIPWAWICFIKDQPPNQHSRTHLYSAKVKIETQSTSLLLFGTNTTHTIESIFVVCCITIMKRFLIMLPAAGHVCKMGWDQIWKDLHSKKQMSSHCLPTLDQLHIKQHVENKHPRQQETSFVFI